MKKQLDLAIPKLIDRFIDRGYISKSELQEFYQLQFQELTNQTFRRILYALEKKNVIIPLGAGLYVLPGSSSNPPIKKKFIPNISELEQNLGDIMKNHFPYLQYILWETRILHEFMIHQPGQNQIILEVEKDTTESVFNKLKELSIQNTFLEPDREEYERYIINLQECIVILPLIKQSPKIRINDIIYARLEKILVDVFSDGKHFFVFQGQELINIFENASLYYWINPKTLFRYAGRRKVLSDLKIFITNQTQMNLPLD